jgi:hypothetical protein
VRDVEWGRDTVRVCRAVLQSSATGEQVRLEAL